MKYKVRRYFTTYQDFEVEAPNEHLATIYALARYVDGDELAENCEENGDAEVEFLS